MTLLGIRQYIDRLRQLSSFEVVCVFVMKVWTPWIPNAGLLRKRVVSVVNGVDGGIMLAAMSHAEARNWRKRPFGAVDLQALVSHRGMMLAAVSLTRCESAKAAYINNSGLS